jgi:hypothetical protein
MVRRGRPATQRDRIVARAAQMKAAGERVNKSRIARELHVPIRTVFRSLSRTAVNRLTAELCHMPQ